MFVYRLLPLCSFHSCGSAGVRHSRLLSIMTAASLISKMPPRLIAWPRRTLRGTFRIKTHFQRFDMVLAARKMKRNRRVTLVYFQHSLCGLELNNTLSTEVLASVAGGMVKRTEGSLRTQGDDCMSNCRKSA